MDLWVNIVHTRLESPEFEFENNFIGGKVVVQKDHWDYDTGISSGWLIHAYYVPIEFQDRPIIGDICFRYGNRRNEFLSVFLQNQSFFGLIRTKQKRGRLIIACRLRKMMCDLDLQKPSSSRQFIVQNFDDRIKSSLIYYVSTVKLNMVGGDLFKKWKTQQETGLMTINEYMENEMIEVLMETCAKYDDVIILKHNIDRLIILARKFRMHKLMRMIEDQLAETKLLNWDEKILIALQYRMSPLYIQVQQKYLLSPWKILCRVQRLLISNFVKEDENLANPYEMMHKHLLELIMLSEENICIG